MLFKQRKDFYKKMGYKGENAAARLLSRLGLKVLLRNYRYKKCEIDIVARDGNTLCFIEVKTHIKHHCERTPSEKLKYPQMKRIHRASKHYLSQLEHSDCKTRYDVVEITLGFAPYYWVKKARYMTGFFRLK